MSIVRCALAEDIGRGDITTLAVIPKGRRAKARIVANEEGVLAGVWVAAGAFKLLDPKIKFMPVLSDGRAFKAKSAVAYIEGDARAILSGERAALNFLGHLCGIASQTARFVKAVKPYKARIMDTRKTAPCLRALEKYAVRVGGGFNHRMGLYDQILVKDNHLKILKGRWPLVRRAVEGARKRRVTAEIEVTNLKEFKEAMKIRPDIIMLDNMRLAQVKAAVSIRDSVSPVGMGPRTKLEVSGGVTLENVGEIARAGADMISVGAITHSSKPIDFSLEIIQ